MKLKAIILALGMLLFSLAGAYGDDNTQSVTSTKNEEIKRLLELTGAKSNAIQSMNMMCDQLLPSLKKAYSNVPERFWDDFMAEFKAEANIDELIDMIIPIYDKFYTEDDIKELIKFYDSPIGKKVISNMPQIMKESMLAGQEWGRKLGEEIGKKVEKRIKEQGY